MNIYFLKARINTLTKNDIYNFAKNQNVLFNDEELDFLFHYIKNNYKLVLNNSYETILSDICSKVKPETANKINQLYNKFKDKLPSQK